VIDLQKGLVAALKAAPGQAFTAEALAMKAGGDPEIAFKILEHLAANGTIRKTAQEPWFESTYGI
jgi:glucose-6-phosphate isomerase